MDLRSKLNLYRQTSGANRQTAGTDQQAQDACRQEPGILQHVPGTSHQAPRIHQHAPGTPHQAPGSSAHPKNSGGGRDTDAPDKGQNTEKPRTFGRDATEFLRSLGINIGRDADAPAGSHYVNPSTDGYSVMLRQADVMRMPQRSGMTQIPRMADMTRMLRQEDGT